MNTYRVFEVIRVLLQETQQVQAAVEMSTQQKLKLLVKLAKENDFSDFVKKLRKPILDFIEMREDELLIQELKTVIAIEQRLG